MKINEIGKKDKKVSFTNTSIPQIKDKRKKRNF